MAEHGTGVEGFEGHTYSNVIDEVVPITADGLRSAVERIRSLPDKPYLPSPTYETQILPPDVAEIKWWLPLKLRTVYYGLAIQDPDPPLISVECRGCGAIDQVCVDCGYRFKQGDSSLCLNGSHRCERC